jgi:hypothetical protein
MLTLIAFIYGIIVSYVQLYDAFCIKELQLTKNQTLQIDLLINDTKRLLNDECPKTILKQITNNLGEQTEILDLMIFFL